MRNLLISLALVFLFAPAALADMSGPATAVEGDLIEIGGERIRLYGIDAPEPGQRCTHLERYPTKLNQFDGGKSVFRAGAA